GAALGAIEHQRRAARERFRRESTYRATFEQAAVGITNCAPDGRFLRANAKYCAMLGYSEAELRQRRFHDILHPDDVSVADRIRASLVAGAASTPTFEHREVRKDGSVLWTSVTVTMVRDGAGAPDYFVALVQDVSERKEAQDKLAHRAQYDPLTELPNRVLCSDR